jgi:transcriptional regulator with XRE-family HTH domain
MPRKKPTRFGRQPARVEMLAQRWSVALMAREIGVPPSHLRNVLDGVVRPSLRVRTRLPKELGKPLADLFTADVLAAPYRPEIGPNGAHRARQSWAISS